MEIQININRSGVMHVVEGLTATMSQHNGGSPTFEELWASVSENKKLDIWWRDGISDLEEAMIRWCSSTSGQFDIYQDGTDYTLTIDPGDRWSSKLTGLLKNKVQGYLVHAVLAGWLSDFRDLNNIPDYRELAASDLKSVVNILLYRELTAEVFARKGDTTEREEGGGGASSGERKGDTTELEEGGAGASSGERKGDTTEREEGGGGASSGERKGDTTEREEGGAGASSGERKGDTTEREEGGAGASVGERKGDATEREEGGGGASVGERKSDDSCIADNRKMRRVTESRDKDDLMRCFQKDHDCVWF